MDGYAAQSDNDVCPVIIDICQIRDIMLQSDSILLPINVILLPSVTELHCILKYIVCVCLLNHGQRNETASIFI